MIFYLVIAIFLAIGIAVLFGSHYLVYFSVIHFFGITNIQTQDYMFAATIFLAVSFVLASVFAHIKENLFTRFFYFAAGLWMGFLANFVLATLAVWAVIAGGSFWGIAPNRPILATIFFTLAVAYSLWGMWNAMHPQLKEISVTIPGLPEMWKNKKIVQLSDVHIGHVHKNSFMKYIVEKINTVGPEMVVITGDLFDGMDGDLETPLQALDEIKTTKGIHFIFGNHENFLGQDFVHKALDKTKVKIMKDEVVDIDGLKLIGINYPEHGETRDAVAVIENLKKDYFGHPNILLYHAPVNIKKFKENGVNLQLSGHTHDTQIFPLSLISRIIFKGFSHGLFEMGDYTLYVSCGTGTWGPPMRTGNTPEIMVITLQ